MNPRGNVLTGVSGEYYVAAELSRLGYIASITLRNTRGIDILVANQDATRSAAIQVKTSSSKAKKWPLNKKAETYYSDDLFYVFVNLKDKNEIPEYHIVPSKTVAEYVMRTHQRWLEEPGKKGQKHKDNPMRIFNDGKNEYLGKWQILNLQEARNEENS